MNIDLLAGSQRGESEIAKLNPRGNMALVRRIAMTNERGGDGGG